MARMKTDPEVARKLRRHDKLLGRLGAPYVSDNGLSIIYVPGAARPEELLVAICGANLRIGGAPDEVTLGIQRSGGRRAALIVADTTLSSFTDPAMVDRVEAEVARAVERLGGPRVLMLGSSIGGHGALHMASRLNAKAALGFAPIFSTDVRVHRETRWAEGQKRLNPAGMATIGDDLSPDCRYVAIYAGDRPVERRHFAALSRVPGIEVCLIRRGGHHVSRELHRAGVLAEAVDAVFAGDPLPAAMEPLLADAATVAEARDIIADEIAANGRPYGPFIDPNMPPPAAAPARLAAGPS